MLSEGLPKENMDCFVAAGVSSLDGAGVWGVVAPEGAVEVLEDGGRSKVTFFTTAGSAFFSSSSFCRNLAIASASKSCFSHFEYDLDWRILGEAKGDVLESETRDMRRPLPFEGLSNGLPSGTGVIIVLLIGIGTNAAFLEVPQSNCFPAFAGELLS